MMKVVHREPVADMQDVCFQRPGIVFQAHPAVPVLNRQVYEQPLPGGSRQGIDHDDLPVRILRLQVCLGHQGRVPGGAAGHQHDATDPCERLVGQIAKRQAVTNADRVLKTFHEFIEENKDEILALRILYDQRYKDRPMAITQLKALYEKLKEKNITIERLWECYAIKKPEKVKRGTVAQLTDLISIIRFEMGYADNLAPFADKVNYNFMQWTLRRNAGAVHFTDEQMEWLRLIKDHIAVSLSIEPEDLDLSPFDRKGGLGRFYDVFGDQYEAILQEMNVELVA